MTDESDFLLDEDLTLPKVVGLLIVLVGVALGAGRGPARQPPSPPPPARTPELVGASHDGLPD